MSQVPPEFEMLMELADHLTPTLEDELSMETEIRAINASKDIEYVKRYAEAMTRQTHDQCRFIAGCLQEIHTLKAKLACVTPVKKNHWLKQLIGLP